MFRNKISVRAHLPSSAFLLIQLALSDPSSPIEIESLCWKLARRWRIACFSPSPTYIVVIYMKAQNESAARLVEELAETLAICDEMVGEEEEASSKYLIAKAVECSLRLLMLENEWKCVGENTFVQSNFSVDEQRNHHQALNVRVQSEKDDDLVFLVSPDVIWFTRHKISDLVSSRSLQSFQQGNLAVVEEDSFLTACTTLPSFYVGHIIGLSKIPPLGEKLEMLEELWMLKHGLALSSEYYINVHFNCGGYTSKQWFPSGFVLRGSEFSPAPKSMRSSMAKFALESFMKIIGGWDFFNQGLLKVKEVSSLNAPIMQPVWKAVGAAHEGNNKTFGSMYSTIDEYISSQNLQLTLDFRTPKPALGLASGSKISDHDGNNSAAVCKGERITDATVQCTLRPETLNEKNNIVKLAAKHLPVSQTQTYQKESTLIKDSVTIKNLSSDATNVKESSKVVRGNKMEETFRDHNCSSKVQKAERNYATGKRTLCKEHKVHSKEDKPEISMKTVKQHAGSSDITSKVLDYHKRGKLKSLTVSDLKYYLANRKAKVGGKKEELVQRVAALLA